MNTWACQYILECVNGNTVDISATFLIALWLFLTGAATLLLLIFEPGADDTPIIAIVVAAAVANIFTIMVISVIADIILNFEPRLFLVAGAAIFTVVMTLLGTVIRNKRQK